MRQAQEGSGPETAPVDRSSHDCAAARAHAPAPEQCEGKQASTMRGKHQGERTNQGGEQEKMLVLGMLQRDCELTA